MIWMSGKSTTLYLNYRQGAECKHLDQIMNFIELSRVLMSKMMWSLTRFDAHGRSLVRALESEDETSRTLALMCLTHAGKRAEPLLLDALQKSKDIPMIITVLGSVGDPTIVPRIRPFIESDDQNVSEAATQAIRIIEAM